MPSPGGESRGGEASGRLVNAEPSRLPRLHAVSRAGAPGESVFVPCPASTTARSSDSPGPAPPSAWQTGTPDGRATRTGGAVPGGTSSLILADRHTPRALASCPPVPPAPIRLGRGTGVGSAEHPPVTTGFLPPRRRLEKTHASCPVIGLRRGALRGARHAIATRARRTRASAKRWTRPSPTGEPVRERAQGAFHDGEGRSCCPFASRVALPEKAS